MKIKILTKASLTVGLLLLFSKCDSHCPKPELCQLEPDPGLCQAAFIRYYYDQKDKKCKSFTWGGCGGTVPFESMKACEDACSCR